MIRIFAVTPVGSPYLNIPDRIIESKCIGWLLPDGMRCLMAVEAVPRDFIGLAIQRPGITGAGGELPLGFGRKADRRLFCNSRPLLSN